MRACVLARACVCACMLACMHVFVHIWLLARACVCVRARACAGGILYFEVNLMYGSVVVALNINGQLYYDMMLIVNG